ncbi:MAG: cytochrome c biogenesis CcdA family protein [Anaerolineae bacterium]
MTGLPLVFAFTAGLFASVNPCGFAMLPSFVAYYLGAQEEGYEEVPLAQRAVEGISLGLIVTLGFLIIFAVVGAAISAGGRTLVRYVPWAALAVGVVLVGLGVWLLAGRSLYVTFVAPRWDVRERSPKAMFLFGIGYAIASLSCTIPIFLAVIGSTFITQGFAGATLVFLSYGLGMGTVLMAVALGTALFKGAVAQKLRAVLPYVERAGAVALIAAGGYLVYYNAVLNPFLFGGL